MSDTPASSRGVRRRINPFGVLTAAAALGAGLLIATYFAHQQTLDRQAAAPQTAPQVTAPALLAPTGPVPRGGVLTGIPVAPGPKASGAGGGAAIGIATAPISLRYTFDGGLGRSIADQGGAFPLRPLSQNDGALAYVPRDAGFAMRFPPRCHLTEKACPRAILEGLRIDALNPGVRPLQYGAAVLMTHADLADGANVMQKGYSVGGVSQFKLQVDHLAGQASCVIASRTRIYRAEAKTDVADGVWHNLVCTRAGDQLHLTIDGLVGASVTVPPALSIANAEPLRVGGKGPNTGNDQFAGQIDNVFLNIG
jgi:hypothetical protein